MTVSVVLGCRQLFAISSAMVVMFVLPIGFTGTALRPPTVVMTLGGAFTRSKIGPRLTAKPSAR
jgi:hypothetical protein